MPCLGPCAAAVAALAVATVVHADFEYVSYWNFNRGVPNGTAWDGVPFNEHPISASHGIARAAGPYVPSDVRLLEGSIYGLIPEDEPGNSLSIRYGTSGQNSGAYLQFDWDNSLFELPFITIWAIANARGPRAIEVLASIDGENYSNVYGMGLDRDNRWNLSFFGITQLAGAPNASIRIVPLWDSSANASGYFALDNIAIEGTRIPAPGAAAVLALALCAHPRRRSV